HQMCLLVRADGKFRIEDQQHVSASSANLIVPVQKTPDGIGGLGETDERVNMPTDGGAHPPTVYESSVDTVSMQQLAAILSAKGIRDIHGNYPQKGQPNYYGSEQIAVSILREGDVQNFGFPDIDTRQ